MIRRCVYSVVMLMASWLFSFWFGVRWAKRVVAGLGRSPLAHKGQLR